MNGDLLNDPDGRRWDAPRPWARCLHLHGLGAHAGWFAPLASRMAESGIEIVAPNLRMPARGGERRTEIPPPGELRALAAGAIRQFRSQAPLFLAGTSLGGCLAVDLAGDRAIAPDPIHGLILFAPAFQPTYLPVRETLAMVLRLLGGGGGAYRTPVARGIEVVGDPALLASLRSDPDAVPEFSARSHLHAQWIIARAWGRLCLPRPRGPGPGGRGGSELPVLCLQGTEDEVVSLATNSRLFARGRSQREFLEVQGGHHDLPWEPTTDGMDERLFAWMRARLGAE